MCLAWKSCASFEIETKMKSQSDRPKNQVRICSFIIGVGSGEQKICIGLNQSQHQLS